MLHTKIHGNRSVGFREEDFWRVFTIHGHGSHLGHVTSIMSINFHFLVPESLQIKFSFDWPSGFWEKQVLSFVCKWPWAKVKKWPWLSILIYVHFFSWFQVTGCKCSEKSSFHFFLQESLSYQIGPCRKIGQGQPRVIIWTNYDGLESQMLHTKFRRNWSAGSGEEDFWFLYGRGRHLGHVTQMSRIKFEFILAFKLVLVTCKSEKDPIRNEGARVLTSLYLNFSDAQGI